MTDSAKWKVRLSATANRSLHRLPAKVAVNCLEFCYGVLAYEPQRLGKPLLNEFSGHWVARRGPYRIVYTVEPDARTITLVRVEHRADVYRSR